MTDPIFTVHPLYLIIYFFMFISKLYKFYSSAEPPPVTLIRNTRFMDMLIK